MTAVQRNVQIKASPQETGALLSDARRWPDWFPGTTVVDVAAPFPEVGGKVALERGDGHVGDAVSLVVAPFSVEHVFVEQPDAHYVPSGRHPRAAETDVIRVEANLGYRHQGGMQPLGRAAEVLALAWEETTS